MSSMDIKSRKQDHDKKMYLHGVFGKGGKRQEYMGHCQIFSLLHFNNSIMGLVI